MKGLLFLLGVLLLCPPSLGKTSIWSEYEDPELEDLDDDYELHTWGRGLLAENYTMNGDLVVCGNNSYPLTVTISGTASATECTVSQSLSDNGADLCNTTGYIFGEECDTFLGGLYINVAFTNPQGTQDPNVQESLAILGLGNLSQIGLLHVSVGGYNPNALDAIDFLPNLQAVIGAPNPVPGNAFTGSALYIAGNAGPTVTSLPSLTRLSDIVGATILQNLALTDLVGLENLQIVEGDLVIQNNPSLLSLEGAAQSLQDVQGQVYIVNNALLQNFAGSNSTGTLKTIGGRVTIGNNPALTSLAGLEELESVGGPMTITQNARLSDISALSTFADCASNSTNQTTPNPVFVQVMSMVQAGAPPISCVMNNFVAICSYIENGGCPNPDGTSALD